MVAEVPVVFGPWKAIFLFHLPPANICFNTYAQMSLQGAIFMLLLRLWADMLLLLLLLLLVNIYYAACCRRVQNLANRILAILCILIAERR